MGFCILAGSPPPHMDVICGDYRYRNICFQYIPEVNFSTLNVRIRPPAVKLLAIFPATKHPGSGGIMTLPGAMSTSDQPHRTCRSRIAARSSVDQLLSFPILEISKKRTSKIQAQARICRSEAEVELSHGARCLALRTSSNSSSNPN